MAIDGVVDDVAPGSREPGGVGRLALEDGVPGPKPLELLGGRFPLCFRILRRRGSLRRGIGDNGGGNEIIRRLYRLGYLEDGVESILIHSVRTSISSSLDRMRVSALVTSQLKELVGAFLPAQPGDDLLQPCGRLRNRHAAQIHDGGAAQALVEAGTEGELDKRCCRRRIVDAAQRVDGVLADQAPAQRAPYR